MIYIMVLNRFKRNVESRITSRQWILICFGLFNTQAWHAYIVCSQICGYGLINGFVSLSYLQAKTVGKYGFQCGLFAGIFSFTRCGIRRYRKKSDWVNALVAGGVAGAAIGAGTRNWRQVAVMTAFLSGFCAIADQSRAI
ncbi:putative mitochondrial import inner membrane translocase subunit TIM22 [Helianthus annuus]|nr:putative mitochondrial import inner membrane translocase subunit TIM22 [Helianthus annuus]